MPPSAPKPEEPATASMHVEEDDEPDDWDKRILDTGCAAENEKLKFCFVDKRDWRLCKAEMAVFRACWAKYGNTSRTSQADM